jgi:hypothetical protein
MSYGRSAHETLIARYELAQGRRVTVVALTTEQAREFAESIDPRCGYIGLDKPLLGANTQSRDRLVDPWMTPFAFFDSIASFRHAPVEIAAAPRKSEFDEPVRARVCMDVLVEVDRYGQGGKPT